ncbi:aminotransferase class I/II-fold pyridoxal phosphate-dependent enzyme, partial [Vibrio cholerae]
MFTHLPAPVLDPILSLSVAFRNDPRPQKVDLGIGVYKNSLGETPIMRAVALAQDKVVASQKTKSYVGLAGCEEFNQSMMQLVLGSTLDTERTIAIQTPGASGALRMLGDLMRVAQPDTTVWITDPSYVN